MGLVSSIKHALYRYSRKDASTPNVSTVADLPFDCLSPKQTEKYIIAEVVAGRMKFRYYSTNEVLCSHVDNYRCGRYHFWVEHPNIMRGTFSYGKVGDCNVSYSPIAQFDLPRVIRTVLNGTDPGETKLGIYSLWGL